MKEPLARDSLMGEEMQGVSLLLLKL